MKKFIKVTFNIPGFHQWRKAPDNFAFLRDHHRHVFYWTILVHIVEDNREIEFIDLKDLCIEAIRHNTVKSSYGDSQLNFGNFSCEMIAKETKQLIEEYYFNTWDKTIEIFSVEVTEDNENGALIIWG